MPGIKSGQQGVQWLFKLHRIKAISGFGGVEWIHLAKDRDWWQALLNMIMDLQVPKRTMNTLTS
jgi:hypothetical protein